MDRYRLNAQDCVIAAFLHDNGDWVKYEDASARIAELEEQLHTKEAQFEAHDFFAQNDQLADKVKELEAHLAAERERIQELESKRRYVSCGYCGKVLYEYLPRKIDVKAMLNISIEHDSTCDRNPLVSRIAELEAQLSAERECNRWIPVEERLPERGKDVLALFEGHVVASGIVYGDIWQGLRHTLPTHWRELPEPPKEET